MTRGLRSITALVVRCCDPDEVVLFGSRAKGGARADSDVDLLIVGDFRGSRWLRNRELQALLNRYPLRIDAHLLTPAEIEVESTIPYAFVQTLRQTSVTLYKRGELQQREGKG